MSGPSKKDPEAYKNPGLWCKTTFIQLGYGVWINLSAMGIGLAFGFPAVMVPQLYLPESDIRPSLAEESWIASVLSLSAPFGCLISGLMSDKYGRSRILFLSKAPMGVGWLYTGFAITPVDVVIGRLITGIGCGMIMSGPRIYLTEISLPNIRGVTGAFPTLGIACGIAVQAGLGAYFHWRVLCYICGAFSIILFLANYFLPETPYYVLLKESEENARKALMKFRSKKHDLEAEMADLLTFKRNHKIHKLKIGEMLKTVIKPFAYRPFFVVVSYFLLTQFSGNFVLIVWAVVMLQNSKSTVDPNFGNMLLGLMRILSGIGITLILFKVRRRTMALVSAGGVGVMCISLGLYIHLTPGPTMFPQLCYMTFIVLSTMGYATLPFMYMSELLPLQVRGVLVGVSVSLYNVFMFFASFLFVYEKKYLGFANTMIMFGIVSFIAFVVLYIFLLETKEFTLQQIEEYYRQEHPILPFRIKPGMDVLAAGRAAAEAKKQIAIKDSTDKSTK